MACLSTTHWLSPHPTPVVAAAASRRPANRRPTVRHVRACVWVFAQDFEGVLEKNSDVGSAQALLQDSRKSLNWARLQNRDTTHRRERANHLLHLIESEQAKLFNRIETALSEHKNSSMHTLQH